MADLDVRTISALRTGEAYATYRKVNKHLGKVYVEVFNSLENRPEGILLEGEYREPSGEISTWSEMEDVFFQRKNRKALEMGLIEKVNVDEKPLPEPEPLDVPDKAVDDILDEELVKLLNQNYSAFSKTLNGINSEKLLKRLIELAKREEKTARIVTTLVSKLSEVQGLNK